MGSCVLSECAPSEQSCASAELQRHHSPTFMRLALHDPLRKNIGGFDPLRVKGGEKREDPNLYALIGNFICANQRALLSARANHESNNVNAPRAKSWREEIFIYLFIIYFFIYLHKTLTHKY